MSKRVRLKDVTSTHRPRPHGAYAATAERARRLENRRPVDHFADQRAALNYVVDHPGCKALDVAEIFDGSFAFASNLLNVLRRKGAVIRDDQGRYTYDDDFGTGEN